MSRIESNASLPPCSSTDTQTKMCKNSDDLKINQNSTANTPLIPKRENMTRISFLEFSKQLSIIVFPGMLFYICIMLVGTINLVYISQTYKDEDMIKAIGICHLYFNSTVACIVHGLISSIDSLGSNAYAAKKYRLLGTYLHKARIIGFISAIIFVGINWLTFEPVLRFLNLNERVVIYSQEYMYACYVFIFPDVISACYFRYLNVIGKSHVNMIILISGIVFYPLNCYIFITILDLAVIGAAIGFVCSRIFGAVCLTFYVNVWNPCPESNFSINFECFIGIWEFLKFAIGACLLTCVEWWAMHIQAFIAISISEKDYTIHVILSQINGILVNCNLGFNMASSVISGRYIVNHSVKTFKKIFWYSLLFGFLTMLVLSSFLYFFRAEIFRLFLDKKEFYDIGIPIICILCIAFIFDNLQSIMMGTLRGLGKNFSASLSVFVQYYLIMSVLSFTLGKILGWGVLGIWTAVLVGYSTGSIFNLLLYLCYDLEKIKLEIQKRLDHDEKEVFLAPSTPKLNTPDENLTEKNDEIQIHH